MMIHFNNVNSSTSASNMAHDLTRTGGDPLLLDSAALTQHQRNFSNQGVIEQRPLQPNR